MSRESRPQVAILATQFDHGGVERMLVNIARGLAEQGHAVDFLTTRADRPYLHTLPDTVRPWGLEADTANGLLTALTEYLARERPTVMMSAKGPDDRLAVQARAAADCDTRIVLRTGTNLSGRLQARRAGPLRRWRNRRNVRRLYARADHVICVSQGVAEDLLRITRLPPERVTVLRNPTITPELYTLAREPAQHPWLRDDDPNAPPVLLGAGALRRQKNFPLLLRAFARVRRDRPLRLIILGRGRLEPQLRALAERLGVADDFDLPGFAENPYAYMARARVFVLSSWWEGSPNVLTESLALGTSVVATDCPSGPREILRGGEVGTLVPMDDEDAMTRAIERALDRPQPAEELRAAVSGYTLAESARAYARVLGIDDGPERRDDASAAG